MDSTLNSSVIKRLQELVIRRSGHSPRSAQHSSPSRTHLDPDRRFLLPVPQGICYLQPCTPHCELTHVLADSSRDPVPITFVLATPDLELIIYAQGGKSQLYLTVHSSMHYLVIIPSEDAGLALCLVRTPWPVPSTMLRTLLLRWRIICSRRIPPRGLHRCGQPWRMWAVASVPVPQLTARRGLAARTYIMEPRPV
jgi:hypothetical protein